MSSICGKRIVERIVGVKVGNKGKLEYLVKWKRRPYAQNSWQCIKHINNYKQILAFLNKKINVDHSRVPFTIANRELKKITERKRGRPKNPQSKASKRALIKKERKLSKPARHDKRRQKGQTQNKATEPLDGREEISEGIRQIRSDSLKSSQLKTSRSKRSWAQSRAQKKKMLQQDFLTLRRNYQVKLRDNRRRKYNHQQNEIVEHQLYEPKIAVDGAINSTGNAEQSNIETELPMNKNSRQIRKRTLSHRNSSRNRKQKPRQTKILVPPIPPTNTSSVQNSEELDENIEQILLQGEKIEQSTVIYQKNQVYYCIPLRRDGKIEHILLKDKDIMRINPDWINDFYQGFLP